MEPPLWNWSVTHPKSGQSWPNHMEQSTVIWICEILSFIFSGEMTSMVKVVWCVCLPCRLETFWLWTDVKCKGPGIKMTASQIQPLGYVFRTAVAILDFFYPEHLFLRFFFSNPVPSPLESPFLAWFFSCFPIESKEERECKGRQTKQHSHLLRIGRADKAAPCWTAPD